jgi:hypothetical protein
VGHPLRDIGHTELYILAGMAEDEARPKMYLVPCSCGLTFAVAENYDRQGTAWSRYLKCPGCGKRHDPKNRLLVSGPGIFPVSRCQFPVLRLGACGLLPHGKLLYFPRI